MSEGWNLWLEKHIIIYSLCQKAGTCDYVRNSSSRTREIKNTQDSELWNVWMWLIVYDCCCYLCLVFNNTRANGFFDVSYLCWWLWRNGWGLSEWNRRQTPTFWQSDKVILNLFFYLPFIPSVTLCSWILYLLEAIQKVQRTATQKCIAIVQLWQDKSTDQCIGSFPGK